MAGSVVALAALTGCPSEQATGTRPPAQATAPVLPKQAAAPAAQAGSSGQNANAGAAQNANASAAQGSPQKTPAGPGGQAAGGQAAARQAAAPPQEPSLQDKQLIDSVEKAYHAGLADYQAGHVESARANFDYAVDLLLRCKCDLRGDEALPE